MRKRTQPESSSSSSPASKSEPRATDEQIKTSSNDSIHVSSAKRSGLVWTVAFATLICASYGVYYYQYEHMPPPLTAEQAGRRGFSELEAMKHVKALTQLGPHAVGSDALDRALQYVLAASQKIKESKHWEADVEVDFFHAKSGANRVGTGVFKGKTLIYSDLNHIVLRILPKYASEAGENAILVSSHIDTVSAGEGAGDCSSCVAVMLELARVMSQWAHEFKNAVIFLFNTGEEEGLNGAHSFVTQHPWSTTIRVAVDLEAMGIGGRSALFQAGPNLWAVENFAAVAKYPSGQIIGQDLFASGVFGTATDFQVYTEVAGLSGLDFAYTDKSAVYHTKAIEACDSAFIYYAPFYLHPSWLNMHYNMVQSLVRFDRNPGGTPEWLGNVIFAVVIAVVSCLTLVYLLSYVHLSGAKGPIAFASFILVGLSIIMVSSGIIPPFSEETARAVNIVHIVDASGKFGGKQEPSSYIALYSATPGKLTKEVEQIKEGFVCGRDNVIDFVTSSMKYGCLTDDNSEGGWSQSDIPTIHVNSDTVDTEGNENERITQVSIDMKGAKRLTLAINAKEIEDFTFKVRRTFK
ncbi:hypothetical protein CICLE_v10030885mg [Citrus x clementina]|uniref:Vacuolar membrane protease n=1 Tax=Citrus clementina TaxID=85681 RepID=V4SPI1_CITCL|nr:hypothetical protein CICLE_v10030885mg [Citrus x clementina]